MGKGYGGLLRLCAFVIIIYEEYRCFFALTKLIEYLMMSVIYFQYYTALIWNFIKYLVPSRPYSD